MSAGIPSGRYPLPSAEDMERCGRGAYTPPATFQTLLTPEQRALILSGWGGQGFGLPVLEERKLAQDIGALPKVWP